MDCMRDAANSIANGIPSRRRQISTTNSSALAPANEMPGATAPARSTNNMGAAESALLRTSSDGTGQSCSSASRSPSRLVATTVTVAECCRIDADHVSCRVEDVLAIVDHQ